MPKISDPHAVLVVGGQLDQLIRGAFAICLVAIAGCDYHIPIAVVRKHHGQAPASGIGQSGLG